MFANMIPLFNKGRILKKTMLENLRDFPRDFYSIYFDSYSNGILAGVNLMVGENVITITKGMLKFSEKIYLLSQDIQIPYFNTNKEMMIKVKFQEEVIENDFQISNTKVFIENQSFCGNNEFELGRFKLREGALLRSDYTDFFDFATEYNTINIINVEYSAVGRSTVSPTLLRYFSKLILKSELDNVWDIGFAMHCLNQELINREVILFYVANRLGIEYKDYNNMEIYRFLTMIIRGLDSGEKRNVERLAKKPTRIIID